MGFSYRRGRPKQVQEEEIDRGTVELRQKRRAHITIEPLDWLRQESHISPQQHWCGLHFRWLYTLRYGTTTPQSLDAAREQGIIHKREYEEWQNEREQEWRAAIHELQSGHFLALILHYCVYQQRVKPDWLNGDTAPQTEIFQLRKGLRELERLWCKGTSRA